MFDQPDGEHQVKGLIRLEGKQICLYSFSVGIFPDKSLNPGRAGVVDRIMFRLEFIADLAVETASSSAQFCDGTTLTQVCFPEHLKQVVTYNHPGPAGSRQGGEIIFFPICLVHDRIPEEKNTSRSEFLLKKTGKKMDFEMVSGNYFQITSAKYSM